MTLEERIEQEKFKARVDRIKANRRIFHNNDEDKIEAFILRAEEHEQLAELLEELKSIREMDLSIPQHFTKEQSDWIKAYCIQRNKEFYNKAIDDFVKKINESNQGHWRPTRYEHGEVVSETMSYDIGTIRLIAEQLKVGDNNGT